MGISVLGRFEVDPRRLSQGPDLQAGFIQDIEIHLGAALSPAFGRRHCMRSRRQQDIRYDIRQLAAFFFVETSLGDPGCAQPDAGRVERGFVSWDGIPVNDDPHQVENAGGLVAGKRCAVGSLDGPAIHIEHVAVRPAEGDAQCPVP